MKNKLKENKAITLIALIITIIVLLILAGIVLNLVLGNNGILSKSLKSRDETNRSQALEELRLNVLDVNTQMEGKATLQHVVDYLNSDNNVKIISYDPIKNTENEENKKITKLNDNTETIYVKYKGYNFKITNKLQVFFQEDESSSGSSGNTQLNNAKLLSYKIKNTQNEEKNLYELYGLYDISGNNNMAEINSIKTDENKNCAIFDGENSYGKINLTNPITYPATVEMTISTTDQNNCLLFLDSNSKIGIGMYNGYFVNSVNTSMSTVLIPNDFYNGDLKHIVVTYNSDVTDFEMYVNGEKLNKNSSYDTWSSNLVDTTYIGRRERRKFL